MYTSYLTSKGQVTIPQELRQLLNLYTGDKIEFAIENSQIILFKKLDNLEASFGIAKSKRTVSLKNIEEAIRLKGYKK
jgi:AbrB family looped-hinge helix DNA binding protein